MDPYYTPKRKFGGHSVVDFAQNTPKFIAQKQIQLESIPCNPLGCYRISQPLLRIGTFWTLSCTHLRVSDKSLTLVRMDPYYTPKQFLQLSDIKLVGVILWSFSMILHKIHQNPPEYRLVIANKFGKHTLHSFKSCFQLFVWKCLLGCYIYAVYHHFQPL